MSDPARLTNWGQELVAPQPMSAVCSNLKHSPRALKGRILIQDPCQGLHRAAACQAAVLGATELAMGLAAGCQLCLVFSFLPWEPQTPPHHGGALMVGKQKVPTQTGWGCCSRSSACLGVCMSPKEKTAVAVLGEGGSWSLWF